MSSKIKNRVGIDMIRIQMNFNKNSNVILGKIKKLIMKIK